MAHYDLTTYIFPTVGACLDFVRNVVRGSTPAIATSHDTMVMSVGYQDGYGAVQIESTNVDSGDTFSQTLTILEIQDGATVAVQDFIGRPGFDVESTSFAYDAPSGETWTLDDARDIWESLLLFVKQEMIDAWSTGVSSPIDMRNVEPLPGDVLRSTAIITAADGSGVYVSQERLVVTMFRDEPEPSFDTIEYKSGIATSQPCVTLDSARIVDALEQLADQYQEISFNHGQSVFSVKGRIITG